MIKKAGSGGSVLLLADAGDYKVTGPINIYQNAAGEGVTIKGVTKAGADMDAHIVGNRPAVYSAANPTGNELFKFQKGAGNLTFENLKIDNTGTAFRAAGDVHDITIQHVEANNVARFFEDYAGGSNSTATVTGLTLKDIQVHGFSKGVVRLQYNSNDILIEDVYGDSQRQDGDNFAIGVHLGGTVHDVLVNRTTMANATDTLSNGYWNGDGFATERAVYDVVFKETVARGNTDAGYDLKSKSTVLIDTFAEDNSRNYRIWGEAEMINPVGLNPHKRGGSSNSQDQVWVEAGASLSITGGYFADAGSTTRVFVNRGSDFSVTDTEVVYASSSLALGNAIDGIKNVDLTKISSLGASSFTYTLEKILSLIPDVIAPVVKPVVDVISAPTPTPVVEKFTFKVSVSTAADETFNAGPALDRFVFDQAKKQGADVIKGFSATDLLQTTKALADGNGDGIITFGKNGALDLGQKAGTVKVEDVTALRALGKIDGSFVYGDAAVRPVKALEGKVGVNDTLAGDKGDKAKTTFFADTALGVSLGDDKLTQFGAKDILVTTTKIAGVAAGAKVTATAGRFELEAGGTDLGSLTITDTKGVAVNNLEYDGSVQIDGHSYFVYSLVGSSVGIDALPH